MCEPEFLCKNFVKFYFTVREHNTIEYFSEANSLVPKKWHLITREILATLVTSLPPKIMYGYKRALCPVLIPRIWCLTLLGQMQSWLCLLNVAFASTATRLCFRSCSFMVLGNTSQSARRTLWTPITSQLSPSTTMERSQTNLPQSSTSGHSGPNWPPEGTPGPIHTAPEAEAGLI